MAWQRSSRCVRLTLIFALTLMCPMVIAFPLRAASPVTVAASGLINPRGFAVGPGEQLDVAIAGQSGLNAGVVTITDGCPIAVVEGLPGYRIVFGAMTGVADVATLDGRRYLLLSGGDIDRGATPNGLYQFDENGKIALIANISSFIRDNPVATRPGDYDTDGQPHALLAMGDGFWVTEGNSNQVLHLGLDGSVTRIADLSAGHPIPTGIAPAPDGGAYVGFLTHAPYREGAASVVQITPDGTVTEVWTGLTLVTALAVDATGALYALEMATGIDADDPASIVPETGKVVRRTGPDTAEDVVTGLPLPVAMEFGPDGALYIAGPAFGADNGEGLILRVDVAAGSSPIAVPPGLLTASTCR
jgi:hypothetical protein